jgi:hypothetical protein
MYVGGSASNGASLNPSFYNNIFSCSGGSAVATAGGEFVHSGTLTINYNNFFNCTNVPTQAATILGDPKFVNAASDWHLQSGSPALNTGTALTAVPKYGGGTFTLNVDIDGTARPQGPAWDLGIYEAGVNVFWSAPGGNDSGACTSSATDPGTYLTIGRAAVCATASPWIINLKGTLGTYSQSTHIIDTGARHAASFSSGASAANQNFVRTAPGEPRVLITAKNGGNGWIQLYLGSAARNNITIREFITDSGGTTDQSIQLAGSNLTLEDCEIRNSFRFLVFSRAIEGTAPNFTFPYSTHIIRRCKLHDTIENSSLGAYAWYGAPRNSIFEDNEVYNVGASGLQLQYDNDNVIVRRNWVHDIRYHTTCAGMTISQRYNSGGASTGVGQQIYNNIFDLRTCPGGIDAPAIHALRSSGTLIANNTMIGGVNGVKFIFGASTNIQVINNIMVGSSGQSVLMEPSGTAAGSTWTATHNACESTKNCATSSNGTITAKQVITAITNCTVSTTNFHLHTNSPNVCRDGGTTVSAVTTDYEGTVRPQGAAYDIGVDESGAQPDTTPPAAPTGVLLTQLEGPR